MSDVNKILNQSDTDIVCDAVKKATGVDLESVTGDFNRVLSMKMLPNAIKIQWQIVNALVRTVVHLAKQNAVMDADYKRGKK